MLVLFSLSWYFWFFSTFCVTCICLSFDCIFCILQYDILNCGAFLFFNVFGIYLQPPIICLLLVWVDLFYFCFSNQVLYCSVAWIGLILGLKFAWSLWLRLVLLRNPDLVACLLSDVAFILKFL